MKTVEFQNKSDWLLFYRLLRKFLSTKDSDISYHVTYMSHYANYDLLKNMSFSYSKTIYSNFF